MLQDYITAIGGRLDHLISHPGTSPADEEEQVAWALHMEITLLKARTLVFHLRGLLDFWHLLGSHVNLTFFPRNPHLEGMSNVTLCRDDLDMQLDWLHHKEQQLTERLIAEQASGDFQPLGIVELSYTWELNGF